MADSIIKETFILTLAYEMSINTDTGEVLETRLIDRTVSKPDSKPTKAKKKAVDDEGTDPKLFLEENKFRLNSAALKLMGIDPESGVKLDIKYENSIPILGTDEAFGVKGGNKLTKAGTVICKGNKNEELSKYGDEFSLQPHSNKRGLFILTGNLQPNVEIKDENISVDVEDTDLPFDLDLAGITEDKDASITEIDSSFFNLNL